MSVTPTTQQTKRKLAETSPDFGKMAKKPVGNMDVEELMNIMKLTMNNLLEEKLESLPTKSDIEEVKAGIASTSAELVELREENRKLKEEINILQNNHKESEEEIKWLENQIKNNKLIFRGISFEKNAMESVKKVCNNILKIDVQIMSAHILSKFNETCTVIAELDSESTLLYLLGTTRNLAGTKISISRDINPRRRRNKLYNLSIKKLTWNVSTKHKITVRDDKFKIHDKWFVWSGQNELICGKDKAEIALRKLYGEEIEKETFDAILEKINSKNF